MEKALELSRKYRTLLGRYGINTFLRLAHFWAQLHHESGLVPKRESVYYTTIEGLRNTFKTPFRGKSDAFVSGYLRNSEKCANYVYANRGGNSCESSGDGYKFRGGGLIQTTFHDGYEAIAASTGVDFVTHPDLILEEANSLIAALEYWKSNDLNKYADQDNLDAVSDIINIGRRTTTVGDSNGYSKRKEALAEAKKIFKN